VKRLPGSQFRRCLMAEKPVMWIVLLSVLLVVLPASAQHRDRGRSIGPGRALAQAEAKPQHARTRIRITPLYPYRRESLPYPPPYDIEYPGPGFVRQCRSWLAPEYRPSGTVIVPHSRCWWERG
jgi:hypothetical protein